MGKRFIHRFKNTILLSWILCFAIIFVIPIIASGVLYRQSVNLMRREIDRVYKAELEKIRYLMDSHLVEMRRIALELSLNENITSLSFQESFGPLERMQLYNLQIRLRDYVVTNVSVKEITVLFFDHDIVISNFSSNSINSFNYQMFNDSLWDEVKVGEHINRYALLPLRSAETLIYMLSLPLQIGSNNNTMVMVKLDPSTVEQIGYSLAGGGLTIHTPESNIQIGNVEEERVSLWLNSEISGIKYEYSIYIGEYVTNIERINMVTFLGLAVCLILCGIIIFFFLRRNYNPILRIMNKLSAGGLIRGFSNEFEYIEKSLDSTFEEAKEMKLQLDNNSNAFWELKISKLITGILSQDEIQTILEQYPTLKGSRYFVVAIHPINYQSWFFSEGEDSEDYLSLVQYIIKNMIDDFRIEDQFVHSITLGENIISLFCSTSEAGGKLQIEQLTELPEMVSLLFDAQICVGVGDIVSCVEDVNNSYIQANEMLQIGVIFNKKFIKYEYIDKSKFRLAREADRMLEINRSFRNMIIAVEFNAAKSLLDEMFTVYFHPNQSLDRIRVGIQSIKMIFLSSLQQWSTQNSATLFSIEDIEDKVESCITVQQLKEKMVDVLEELDDQYSSLAQLQLYNLRNSAMKYIDENYQNYDIGVNSIAEHLNLSNSHFSKMFKKATGRGALDYLHERRLRQAKLYLHDGKYTIGQIAEMVGYNDANSFIRIFKKYEGITPGKYQSIRTISTM